MPRGTFRRGSSRAGCTRPSTSGHRRSARSRCTPTRSRTSSACRDGSMPTIGPGLRRRAGGTATRLRARSAYSERAAHL
eukprot:1283508-Prymnesium_polylepis.1